MNVAEYDASFTDLARYAPHLIPTYREKVFRFVVDGLRYHTRVTLVDGSHNGSHLDIVDT